MELKQCFKRRDTWNPRQLTVRFYNFYWSQPRLQNHPPRTDVHYSCTGLLSIFPQIRQGEYRPHVIKRRKIRGNPLRHLNGSVSQALPPITMRTDRIPSSYDHLSTLQSAPPPPAYRWKDTLPNTLQAPVKHWPNMTDLGASPG